MASRVSPTESIRAEIAERFASGDDVLSVLEQVARLSVRLTFQSVVEELVCEELGRQRYERRSTEAPEGHRNGWQKPRPVKTALGAVSVQRPKLRHAHAALCDQLFGKGVTRTNALETLVISCWVRGLSDRDIEAMLAEVFGDDATISRSTASRICRRLQQEFTEWQERDLAPTPIDYLFLDATYFKMHAQAKAEPVLCARGIDRDGHAVFLGMTGGTGESTEGWRSFLKGLKDHGLGEPLLIVTDGGKGLCAALEYVFPRSLHQRCTIHLCRNLIEKVSKHDQGEAKREYWAIFDQITEPAGDGAVAEGRRRAQEFIGRWQSRYPGAVACLEDNLDALLVHLRFPQEHQRRVRQSNFIERTFGETRRRVKVIGRLPGEHSCLTLVWAVLDRASRGWRGLTMTPQALRQLQELRRELLPPSTKRKTSKESVREPVTAAA